ncbi:MAG: hypothetical protein Kow00109_03660 [Acidobacteriota bacterium]
MSIRLEHITKRFGTHVVLDRISADVRDGEFFVLLGRSGSGKSTLLRVIAGLEAADSGRIVLHDRDVTAEPPRRRNIGMVFQDYLIFRHMTVGENIEFPLRLRGVRREERRRRREELLDLVGLAGFDDRLPHQLSGGQQQRVALARALAHQPAVLLLDEPFGALDLEIRRRLRRNLRRIQRALRVTTILVTHDQEEAFELADRIAILERGRLLEVGRPEDLYWRPATGFTATFLGGGLLLVGRVEHGVGRFGRLSLELPVELRQEAPSRVQLLVRPEQVRLSGEAPADPSLCLGQGVVIESWFGGSHRRVRLRLPHLPGTRQVHPPPLFGDSGLLVDALLPGSEERIAESYWVSLRSWHLLRAPDFRFLLLRWDGESAPETGFGRRLVERLEATAVELVLGGSMTSRPAPSREIEKVVGPSGGRVEVRQVSGNPAEEVSRELQQTLYDFVFVECWGKSSEGDCRAVQELLDSVTTNPALPTFVSRHPQQAVTRMLICTRAGEPGKEDIRLGGRLARRLGVPVTLLHVFDPQHASRDLASLHLQRATETLAGLDLDVSSLLIPGRDVAATILREAERLQSDLVVVGAHWRRSPLLEDRNITRSVIDGARCCVLVVPPPDSEGPISAGTPPVPLQSGAGEILPASPAPRQA